MIEPDVIDLPLPDAAARARIAEELDTNLLVEAGAGSGKTTALVGRMVELVASNTAKVEEIAAVTFTRKAAGELRERFQMGIETRLASERSVETRDEVLVDRLSDALDDIDRAFIGTIHSFCARLLRERPLDVGLDPSFQELPVEERLVLRHRFWESFLERMTRDSDPRLEELANAGLKPKPLYDLFDKLVENPDVDFPADDIERPSLDEVGAIREELEAIVDRGWELMDDRPPARGWDSFQKKIRRLRFERDITEWREPADLFDAVAVLCKSGTRGHNTTLNRWRDKALAKELKERANDFGVGDTKAQRLVNRWYAHRYALAIRLARSAAEAFEEHRRRIGKLDFQDLLVLAARLLRDNPRVRRQLGRRYRRLLVDEFQDTDPLQAEIMLLLSSEPETGEAEGDDDAEDPAETGWQTVEPRPGALFVVGDPKQSIYRFRRADIQLYGFVKERFAEFGDVVALSTNFRSRPAIGDLVNDLFCREGFFPAEATREQAAFERLDTRPPEAEVPNEGVFTYQIDPDQSNKAVAAADDAARLATWIRDRVDAEERSPGDFLVLTRDRGQIESYAQALEAHSLPVEVTGAGVGVEVEIRELQVLLECMIDPTNPVCVVAALVGLFFGIDYDALVTHRLDGGGLDAMRPADRGHPEVVGAIRRLHGWWKRSTVEPADVFIGRLVSELGLLPLSAAGELGTLRAGALLYVLDTVRAATLTGDASLPGALESLSSALDLKEAEAPLEPLRPDAVRLMNLHQAKGLEATVVILANPTESRARRPDIHLSRESSGLARGFLRVTEASTGGFRSPRDLARPIEWQASERAETRFDSAEEVRLLYVAATRACQELVVARWTGGRGTSVWGSFDPWLDEHAEALALEAREPAEREVVTRSAEEIEARIGEVDRARDRLRMPTYRHTTVTEVTKGGASPSSRADGARPRVRSTTRDEGERLRGFSWGSAVHGALAAAAGEPDPESLRAACRDLLVQYQRPLDDHGEPTELAELLDLVRSVRASDLWKRSQAAERSMAEVPFAVRGFAGPTAEVDAAARAEPEPRNGGGRRKQLDLFGGEESADTVDPSSEVDTGSTVGSKGEVESGSESGGGDAGSASPEDTVLEGVVDLVFQEEDGWVIADYKTDVGTDPEFAARAESYRRQVELYAEAWTRLTGEPVKERVLFYTAQDRTERW